MHDDSATRRIRPARPEDVPRLRELGVIGWETTYASFVAAHNRARYLAGPFWSLETLNRIVRDPACLTLVSEEPDGTIGGFLNIEPVEDQRVELTRFYVDPEIRRGGAGSALFNAALTWSRERSARSMLVNVFADNTIGRAFYERAGFQLTSLDPYVIGDQTVGDAWYELLL
jgi:ribosomal protein S18 acetylase RimI-like enzyme